MSQQLQRILVVIGLVSAGPAIQADQITGLRQPPFEGMAAADSIVGAWEQSTK